MNNEDRELLEMAAKAAGITGGYVEDFGSGEYYYTGNTEGIYHELPDGGYFVWNPLTNDGDALRLAVSLNVCVSNWKGNSWVSPSDDPNEPYSFEPHDQDPYAATRRAITRAAAEIGKTHK